MNRPPGPLTAVGRGAVSNSSVARRTMAGEFFDHAQSENRLFDGVMQHVEADQPRVEITVGIL